MSNSNRDLCIKIIEGLPEDQLSHVANFLKSVEIISEELFSESKTRKLTEIYNNISNNLSFEAGEEKGPDVAGDLDTLAEKIGIKLKLPDVENK